MTRFPLIHAVFLVIVVANAFAAPPTGAADHLQHFSALSKLSVEVADVMPPAEYNFRPDPPSMTFGELMSHIAVTNYQFCAGLRDVAPPNLPSPIEKEGASRFSESRSTTVHP